MSDTVLIKLHNEIDGIEIERQLQDTLHIPKEYISIIEIDSKEGSKKSINPFRK